MFAYKQVKMYKRKGVLVLEVKLPDSWTTVLSQWSTDE